MIQEFFTTYLEPIILFISGGGLATLFTVKYTRKTAQADAMKAVQDVYQETITDLRKDKELMKEESTEFRKKIELMQKEIEQNTRDITRLSSLKCTVTTCTLRKVD